MIGPPLGGGLSHRYGLLDTCRKMGFVAAYFFGFYLLLAGCNRYFKGSSKKKDQDTFRKDIDDWRRKKQDDIGKLINELADQKTFPQ